MRRDFVARVPIRRRPPKVDGDVSTESPAVTNDRCIAANCRVRWRKYTVIAAADAIRARSAHPESAVKVSSLLASDVLATLSSSKQGQVLLQFALSPTCAVDTYHLEYQTVGARGEA